VHHHADRLVDDDQLVVLEEDVERDVLRLRIGVFRRRRHKDQLVAELHLGLGFECGLTIDRRRPGQYQVLDAVAREGGKRLGEHGVEPAAREIRVDRHRKVLVLSFGSLHERSQFQRSPAEP